jgi:hypothetical protein
MELLCGILVSFRAEKHKGSELEKVCKFQRRSDSERGRYFDPLLERRWIVNGVADFDLGAVAIQAGEHPAHMQDECVLAFCPHSPPLALIRE